MAVPKKRTSKMKRDQRRSHHRITPNRAVECPQCSEPKQHHRVCGSCGYYKGVDVVVPKD
jgi:large subunit ribosomal protein L32